MLRAAVEHLEDLDALLVADAEIGHERVGVDLQAVFGRRVRCSRVAAAAGFSATLRTGLLAEHDVLPHREVGGEHEVLEDHADPGGDGVLR